MKIIRRDQYLDKLIGLQGTPDIKVKVNLDMGHAKVGKASLEDWIISLKNHISYMHIHSNDGLYDQHQPPNTKEIKTLFYLLDKYDIQPIISLEYKINNIEEEIKKYF